MKLYIVRHGIAQEPGSPGVSSDDDRALTDEGRDKTRAAAEGLRTLGCRPDCIGTSPLCRAEQTARIMADVLAPKASFKVCKPLAPGGRLDEFVAWLRRLKDEQVMIVGHMPGVAEFASGLLAEKSEVDLVFKKAGTCCISFDGEPGRGRGCLEWMRQPRQLRDLGKS